MGVQEKTRGTGLIWFRNDLRLADNTSFIRAIEGHRRVIAVYCLEPELREKNALGFYKCGPFRMRFLLEAIKELKISLLDKNISLVFSEGSTVDSIAKLVKEHRITDLYFQKEWTTEEVHQAETLKTALEGQLNFHAYFDQFLYHPQDFEAAPLADKNSFTAFKKYALKEGKVRFSHPYLDYGFNEENLIDHDTEIPSLASLGYPDLGRDPRSAFPFSGGEQEGWNRLNYFFYVKKAIGTYIKTRNRLIGQDYSAKLSPFLATGCISARVIYWNLREFEDQFYQNQSTYWFKLELMWRDYFKYLSMKFGHRYFSKKGLWQQENEMEQDREKFFQWAGGQTGDPFVDANMKELNQTGWMSNRGRQNVASYLVHDLGVDWRWGAAYFESMLIDFDVHSNYGNWLYVSGLGTGPKNKKFDTRLQAKMYDEKGKYQNLWLQTTLF